MLAVEGDTKVPKITKIQIAHLISTDSDLFAFDNEGRVWRRTLTSPNWEQDGEVPDEPALVETRHDQLVIDAPDGLDEEEDKEK
jgi:hypothetical protein